MSKKSNRWAREETRQLRRAKKRDLDKIVKNELNDYHETKSPIILSIMAMC